MNKVADKKSRLDTRALKDRLLDKAKWKALPLKASIKDLLIGRSCFSKDEIDLINLKSGYYTALPASEGHPLDQIHDKIFLYLLDDEGNLYNFCIE